MSSKLEYSQVIALSPNRLQTFSATLPSPLKPVYFAFGCESLINIVTYFYLDFIKNFYFSRSNRFIQNIFLSLNNLNKRFDFDKNCNEVHTIFYNAL